MSLKFEHLLLKVFEHYITCKKFTQKSDIQTVEIEIVVGVGMLNQN